MEKNSNIFLTGGIALGYLAEPVHRNVPQHLFGAIHLVHTYLMTNFSNPFHQCAPVQIMDNPHPFPQLRTYYLMDGLFLNQKINKAFEYCIHWNINIRKKKLFTKKWMVMQDEINIQGSRIIQKHNSTMSVMLCTVDTFLKKNSCLVATIVSFDTLGLHLLNFCILEPYLYKDILTLMTLLQYLFSLVWINAVKTLW